MSSFEEPVFIRKLWFQLFPENASDTLSVVTFSAEIIIFFYPNKVFSKM